MEAETEIGSSRADGIYGPVAPVLSRVRGRTGDVPAHRATLQKARLFVSWLWWGLGQRAWARRSAHRSLAIFPTVPPAGTLGETPADE